MTEVALAPATPHAPSVIRLMLGKLGIAYEEVLDHHGLNAARKVQAVLLDDAVGTLMVLFPQSQLLDLNSLAELTGRRLTAVSTERLVKMLGKHNLSLLPGMPALTSTPCLYEESLLREPKLLINSGEPGVLLEITSEDFKTMLTKASAANFGEALTSIRPNSTAPTMTVRKSPRPFKRSPRGASSNAWKRPSKFRRWPRPRRKSSSCALIPTPPSTTSPASSKPTRPWPHKL